MDYTRGCSDWRLSIDWGRLYRLCDGVGHAAALQRSLGSASHRRSHGQSADAYSGRCYRRRLVRFLERQARSPIRWPSGKSASNERRSSMPKSPRGIATSSRRNNSSPMTSFAGVTRAAWPIRNTRGLARMGSFIPSTKPSESSFACRTSCCRRIKSPMRAWPGIMWSGCGRMGRVLDAVRDDVARQAKASVIPPDFVIDASDRTDEGSDCVACHAQSAGRPSCGDERKRSAWMTDERDALVDRAARSSRNPFIRRIAG